MQTLAGIILCAGKGSRMGTDCPKILYKIAGKSLYSWSLDSAIALKAHPIILTLGHQYKLIKKDLDNNYRNRKNQINITIQKNQLGTGHAVGVALKALANFDGTILILYGDTPLLKIETLKSLINLHRKLNSDISMLTSHVSNPTGYGRILRHGSITSIVEEFHATSEQKLIREVNSGVYLFNSSFLKKNIHKLKVNASDEIYLTDLINLTSKPVESIIVSENEILGVNNLIQLSNVEKILRKRINEYWMLNGVHIVDPETTYIDFKVQISKGAILEPGVVLIGSCKILPEAIIKSYSILEDVTIGENSHIGPFANIRPKTIIGSKCKIGNFVELKESNVQKRTKINHLSYVGNSSIGKFCNIGAGSITCNYDSYHKYDTRIGNEVFVGSNTTLIAPLCIHSGSYIAAGSTINNDIPKKTFAIGRSFQQNKQIK